MVAEQHRSERREVTHEPGLPSYDFARSVRGFDAEQVSRCLWRLEQDRQATLDRLERAHEEIAELRRSRSADTTEPDTIDAGQVTGVIRLAERTAALIVSEAHAAADRRRIETEQALAYAEQELRQRQRALTAEAERVADLRRKLAGDMSRASVRLVQIVDGDGGLGPFSEQTGSLLEFAELLVRSGGPVRGAPTVRDDLAS